MKTIRNRLLCRALGAFVVVVVLIVVNLFKEKAYIRLCEWLCIAILPGAWVGINWGKKHRFLP